MPTFWDLFFNMAWLIRGFMALLALLNACVACVIVGIRLLRKRRCRSTEVIRLWGAGFLGWLVSGAGILAPYVGDRALSPDGFFAEATVFWMFATVTGLLCLPLLVCSWGKRG